jgi:predicted nucleotide-binding protein (sugar kinase/HSP70/actin superfamily)
MEEKGTIGIPRALMFYRFFPFWQTFFEKLDWKVVVSDEVGKKGKIVYFEDSCLPMKLVVTHSVSLKDKVDHLFVPRLVSLHKSYIMCPKFRGAPDIVRLATEGKISILDETIDLRESSYLQTFLRIGKKLGASEKETRQAFSKAQKFFSIFQKEWADRINRVPSKQLFQLEIPTPSAKNTLQKIFPPLGFESQRRGSGEEGERGPLLRVAVIGHPYNLFDSDINKDILTLMKSLGMEIVTSDSLPEKEIDRHLSGLSKEVYWSSGREIVGALFHFLSGVVDGAIFLTSFKCGIDALLQEFVKRTLKARGGSPSPFLILSFDEHTGREGLTTRLEAFRDVMEQRKAPNSKPCIRRGAGQVPPHQKRCGAGKFQINPNDQNSKS